LLNAYTTCELCIDSVSLTNYTAVEAYYVCMFYLM